MSLLNQVKDAIYRDPTTPHQPGNDPSGLIGRIEGLFSNHAATQNQGNMNVLPASQDPYGDPALQNSSYGYLEGQPQGYGTGAPVVPSQYGNVRPASEDPLGDPADQER